MVVTATFGMVAAGHMLRKLAEEANAAKVAVPALVTESVDAVQVEEALLS
jgi:hypothetical protein